MKKQLPPCLNRFYQSYAFYHKGGHMISITDGGQAIEIKISAEDRYYYVIEKVEDKLVLSQLLEEERDIPFDLSGFDLSRTINSDKDCERFAQMVIQFIGRQQAVE